MKKPVLLDTAPLVAFLNARDQHHAWACDQFKRLEPPLLTCEAVIAEACFLLGENQTVVMELIRAGVISVNFDMQAEHAALLKLLKKYADIPISLADACLVRMSELHDQSPVFTLDRDFMVYRKNSRHIIPRIMPEV